MLAVVSFRAGNELRFVSGELERGCHALVGQIPASGVNVQIVAAVLKKDAQRLWFGLADQRRIDIAAAQVRVTANETQHAAEGVGPIPGSGKGRDTTRTR